MLRVPKNTIVNSGHIVGSQTNDYEVNRRSVLALYAFGQGPTRLSTFCGLMDLPQSVSYSNYDINKILSDVCDCCRKFNESAVTDEHY